MTRFIAIKLGNHLMSQQIQITNRIQNFMPYKLICKTQSFFIDHTCIIDTNGIFQTCTQCQIIGFQVVQQQVRVDDDAVLHAAAVEILIGLFLEGDGVAAALEVDGRDEAARHVVIYNRLGQPVATGRLITQSPGVGRIGRLAVDRDLRGSRLGRQVLDALVAASQARGDREVLLHAQRSAEGFYRRAGFVPVGAVFEEAGIAHITMRRTLA